jgi:limonene-1,2-epoxide hydrolase
MPTTEDVLTTNPAAGRSPVETVKAFLSALERFDFDAATDLAAPGIRWVNVPITSAVGKNKFDKACRGMFRMVTRFEVQYRDIHERGEGVVYTDRVDIAEGNGLKMKLDVKGEFRVEDGLIVEWVDRFSWPKVVGEIVRSVPAMLAFRFRG